MTIPLRDSVDWGQLLANLSDVIYVIRLAPDPGFEFVSDSVTAVVGYTPEEHYDDPDLGRRLVDPRDLRVLARSAEAPIGETVDMLLRWMARDGRSVWTQHRARKRLRQDGSLVLEGVARDVTALHEAQEQVERAQNRFRLLAENASDVVYLSSVDGRCLWVSPSVRAVLGWDPEDLVGTHPADLVHPDDAAAVTEHRWHIVIDGEPQDAEVRYRCADGSHRWMSVRGRPYHADEAAPSGAVVGLRDVHEAVLARKSLQDTANRYQLIAENSSDVVFRATLSGLIEWASPSARAVLGWDPEGLVGRSPVAITHPMDLPAVGDALRRVALGESVVLDLRQLRPDGTQVWTRASARPLLDPSGKPRAVVVTLRDIEAEMSLRAELADCQARLTPPPA